MGNCTGKLSKRKGRQSKEEMYRPSNDVESPESKEENNQPREIAKSTGNEANDMKEKTTFQMGNNSVKVPTNDNQSSSHSNEMNPIESRQKDSNVSVEKGDYPVESSLVTEKTKTHVQKSKISTAPAQTFTDLDKKPYVPTNDNQSSSHSNENEIESGKKDSNISAEKGDNPVESSLVTEKAKTDVETSNTSTAPVQKFTDLDKKPYEFAQANPQDQETQFIDTKSKPYDMTSPSENAGNTDMTSNSDSTKHKDNNQEKSTGDNPIPTSTEVPKERSQLKEEDGPAKKAVPEDSGDGKQQQGKEKRTGYSDSQFSKPGDEQDEKTAKEHRSSQNSKKSKKKKDFPDPPKDVNYVAYIENLNIGNKEVIIKGNNKKDPVNIEPTFVVSHKESEILLQVSASVGFIDGHKESGTCWRVGVDKIITAFHVVRNNIWDSMGETMVEPKLSEFKVVFDFIDDKSHPSYSNNVFKVESRVIYFNESLDVAVLELKKDEKRQFPPALRIFHRLDPKHDSDKKIFLISHNKGKKKEFNGGIGLWKPSEKRLRDLEKFCHKNGWHNGYTELDKEGRLILKCEFEGGASGSPGIIIQGDTPYIVLLYIRGFPDFYYSQQFSSEQKRTFPRDKILQQGVNIGAILDDLTNKPIHRRLRDEIFSEQAKTEKEQNQHPYAMGEYDIGKNENSVPEAGIKSLQEQIQTCTDDIDKNTKMDEQLVLTASTDSFKEMQSCTDSNIDNQKRQASQVLPSGKDVTDSQILLSGKRQNLNLSHYTSTDDSKGLNDMNSTEDVTDIPAVHQNRMTATIPDQDSSINEKEAVTGESDKVDNKNQGNTQPVLHLTVDEWAGPDYQLHKDKYLKKDKNLMNISKAVGPDAFYALGVSLGYQKVDVDRIKMNDPREPCYPLLVKWRNRLGHTATLDKLVHILFELSERANVDNGYLKDAIIKFED